MAAAVELEKTVVSDLASVYGLDSDTSEHIMQILKNKAGKKYLMWKSPSLLICCHRLLKCSWSREL